MNNDELEKYLNSLILCQEYYFPHYEQHIGMQRITGDVNTHILGSPKMNSTICYYSKKYIPQNYSCNFSFVKKFFSKFPSSRSYSDTKSINYFLSNLKKILNEYLEKNNLNHIQLSFIKTTGIGTYNYGYILIPAGQESFLIFFGILE